MASMRQGVQASAEDASKWAEDFNPLIDLSSEDFLPANACNPFTGQCADCQDEECRSRNGLHLRVPYFVIDDFMPKMTGNDLKVLTYVARRATFDRHSTHFGRTALSYKNITTATGVKKPGDCLRRLQALGLVGVAQRAKPQGGGWVKFNVITVRWMHALKNLGGEAPESPEKGKGKRKGKGHLNLFSEQFQNSPDFCLAWAEWERYNREKGHRLTHMTAEKQVALLSRHSMAEAVGMIERSIRGNWVSLQEPKNPCPEGKHFGVAIYNAIREESCTESCSEALHGKCSQEHERRREKWLREREAQEAPKSPTSQIHLVEKHRQAGSNGKNSKCPHGKVLGRDYTECDEDDCPNTDACEAEAERLDVLSRKN